MKRQLRHAEKFSARHRAANPAKSVNFALPTAQQTKRIFNFLRYTELRTIFIGFGRPRRDSPELRLYKLK